MCVVQGFDHHCPWIGTDIGRRNYRYFLFYVLVQTVLCVYVCAASAAHLGLETRDSGQSFWVSVRM